MELIAEIASRILASQLSQIKLWQADDVDIIRLERLSVTLAYQLVEAVQNYDQPLAPIVPLWGK